MTFRPSPGIYDRLLDQDLTDLLARYPELRPLFGKLEAEEQPSRYAEFVSQVLRQALLEEPDPERRRVLCNRIIDLLAGPAGTPRKSHLENRKLIPDPKPVLLEITPPHYAGSGIPRPRTSMVESSLFTGSPREPQLVQELLEEMRSADAVDISKEHFWRNGRYDDRALEKVYTGDDIQAKMRADTIVRALDRYEPARETIKGVGFCVTIRHARFMADAFNRHGIASAAYVSDVDRDRCDSLLAELRSGRLVFLFTVDKFSEGVDVPEINMVLFLRPTQSLTVFLQQLGRGLRHAPEKECLTVLDFVGQVHRKYRMDIRLKALLHWESQSNTALDSPTGQNLVHHQARGYTILVFARPKKKHNNCTVPFVFLGPARHVSHQTERPIQMVWELSSPMPVEMFEENRLGG